MEINKDTKSIGNIELVFLKPEDYLEIKEMMIETYSSMANAYWKEHHIKTLTSIFHEGQVGIRVDNELAGVHYQLLWIMIKLILNILTKR